MQVIVRPAAERELEAIQDMNHKLFISDARSDSNLHINWPYEKEGGDYFRRMIAGENGVCFVAELDGKVIGYLPNRS